MKHLTYKQIKKVLNGKIQIYDEDEENRYVYYTQIFLAYRYDSWYFSNEDKSFKFEDYKKTWWLTKK